MELKEYIEKGGQKLRLGYTTGSCAAAASKAAVIMLLTGRKVPQVRLLTPGGRKLILDIEDICFREGGSVSCAVRKDSGDDPDITNHTLIYAEAALSATPGIRIDGGEGVGRVTKPGLDQPVGNAAINSTPRKMIREAVLEAMQYARDHCDPGTDLSKACRPTDEPDDKKETEKDYSEAVGLDITIFVPQGRELAEKTFNPKLGIEGGISILGTTGIVEPMSDQALLDTIRVEIRVRKEEGLTVLPAAPGNYGRSFFLEKYGFSLETAVTASNFIYDTVRMAADAGFQRMLFVGHIGKLVKVAGGIRNTHSQYGDHRMEILTEIAEGILFRDEKPQSRNGSSIFESLQKELSDCVMTDEAINILRKYGLDREVCAEMTRRIQTVMQEWALGRMQVEVVVFSNAHGELGRTENALAFMQILQDQVQRKL